jgi:hypothetical protein
MIAALALAASIASQVYPGCVQPPATYATTTTVTAATIGAALVQAQLHPGSLILLETDDYHTLRLQGWHGDHNPETLVGWNLPGWTTIAAAPGATPMFSQIQIVGGNKLAFRGLTVQAIRPTPAEYELISVVGPHSDIVFDQMTVQSQTAPFSTQAAWKAQRSSGFTETAGSCVAITNSHFRNIGFGIQTGQSTNVLIEGDTIDYFTDDGIDFGSSNLTITGNGITNAVEDNDGIHRDGMQGQPPTEATVNSNIVFSFNTIIRDQDPANPYPAYLQGIDAFDGLWTNITVTGNRLWLTSSQGISFYGVTGATVSKNTVSKDGGRVMKPGATATVIDLTTIPGITIQHSKAGSPSSNVTLTGNQMAALGVDISTTGLVMSDNYCTGLPKCVIGYPVAGKMLWAAKSGVYPGVTIGPAPVMQGAGGGAAP